jgi:hypothetical protein
VAKNTNTDGMRSNFLSEPMCALCVVCLARQLAPTCLIYPNASFWTGTGMASVRCGRSRSGPWVWGRSTQRCSLVESSRDFTTNSVETFLYPWCGCNFNRTLTTLRQAVAKASHAWQRWSSEGRVDCSCKHLSRRMNTCGRNKTCAH